jgi:hypothetical protein
MAQAPPVERAPVALGHEHENYRKIENLHIYLWLFKDLCWCLDYKTMGMVMIVPTVIGAVWMLFAQRKNLVELIHNFAVCSWICANATWMIGEFYFDDHTRKYALVFFIMGILVLTIYYAQWAARWMARTSRTTS